MDQEPHPDKALAEKMAESFNILSILEGESVGDVILRSLGGTPVESVIQGWVKKFRGDCDTPGEGIRSGEKGKKLAKGGGKGPMGSPSK